MTLLESSQFEVVCGSVIGREHRRRGLGGQDAAAVVFEDGVVCAAVADGCSSGRESDVGARLSAAWLAAHGARFRLEISDDAELAEALVGGLVGYLGGVADGLASAGGRASVVGSMLLATVLVALVEEGADGRALVFGVGDGVVSIDGVTRIVGDGSNTPAYPAYRLFDPVELTPATPGWLAPRLHFEGRARAVSTIALATDGACELESMEGEALRDGSRIESIAALAGDPRFRKNPSLLAKRLFAIGDVNGRLADDTTIVVLARAATTEGG